MLDLVQPARSRRRGIGRRPQISDQPQDLDEQRPRHGDLGHLEGDLAAMGGLRRDPRPATDGCRDRVRRGAAVRQTAALNLLRLVDRIQHSAPTAWRRRSRRRNRRSSRTVWGSDWLGEVAVDGGLQVDQGMESAAFEAAVGQRGEEALDGIQPRRRGPAWSTVRVQAAKSGCSISRWACQNGQSGFSSIAISETMQSVPSVCHQPPKGYHSRQERSYGSTLSGHGSGRPPLGGPVCMLVHDRAWRDGWNGRRSWPGLRSRPYRDFRGGWSVAKRRVRADRVVVVPPAFDDDLGFLERVEDLAVEQLVAQLGVEALE